MKHIYLDYAATSPVKKEVLEEMLPYFHEEYGNPSSLYSIASNAKEAIELARTRLASLIRAKSEEVFFTSCGSESDNWALFGVADALRNKGNHIITTAIEHHAVLHSAKFMKKRGFEVTYLPVDQEGKVRPEDLEEAITDKTVLVSIMYVNNEIGTIQDVQTMAKIAHEKGVLFHTDAVQALGNIPIDVKALDVDLLSLSAHKIYGPKGVGALYIKKGTRISNYLHGGGQESKRRPGTQNVTGIVGFGKAAAMAEESLEEHIAHVKSLRDHFIHRVTQEIDHVFVNGSLKDRHPGNANITFEYIEGEAILLLLNQKGIFVSTGSACSSASLVPSHVLAALGVPHEKIHGTIRFSFGDFTKKEEVDYTVDILKEIVPRLREISSVDPEKGW